MNIAQKKFYSLFLTLLISFPLIIRPTYASPPWLIVGFYAKYNLRLADFQPIISLEDPHNPEFSYFGRLGNGTFIWKVEKLEKNIALIKVNFSIIGFDFSEGPMKKKVELSRSFHILVDINNRFILNTSEVSPLYFPYWIPIGTREGEEFFMGYQKLENTWLVGKFYRCGMDIDTGLKRFRGSDLLFFTAENITTIEVPKGYLPFFDGFYDRESGILIALIGTEQLSLKFLNIWIINSMEEIMLEEFGVEPVSSTAYNDSSTNPLVTPSISILGIVVPSEVEVEKEFELSLMLFNNGTINTGNLRVLLLSLNGNFKTLSDSEVLVENISPGETKEVKWRLTLRSEGECHLRLSILKDTTLLQKDLVIRGRHPWFRKAELFIVIIPILFVLILLTSLGRRRRKCLSPYYLGKSRV